MKVAVYGSLLKTLSNHKLLEESEYLGEFHTDPEFSLYSLGSYPGLKKNGITSIRMEVYRVSKDVLKALDQLEGYDKANKEGSYYKRFSLPTPYGLAFSYEYNNPIKSQKIVASGNWVEYKRLETVMSYV